MGLDMYAYAAARAGQQSEFYEGAVWDSELKDTVNPDVEKPREIAYWRKHPNLHGWMAEQWNQRNGGKADTNQFNGIELELSWQDIDNLEAAVKARALPATSGFFFGNEADDYYYDHDLEFVKQARADLFLGLKVFYNSSW
jgi:hypothetical protein